MVWTPCRGGKAGVLVDVTFALKYRPKGIEREDDSELTRKRSDSVN